MAIELCLSMVCTTLGDTPCSRSQVAKVCRASCRRRGGQARLSDGLAEVVVQGTWIKRPTVFPTKHQPVISIAWAIREPLGCLPGAVLSQSCETRLWEWDG